MRNFFITGLPRSRTAWLANFFTWENNFCYHDILSFTSPVGMAARFAKTGFKNVGDSDSALVLRTAIMTRLFPNAPWVFVVRPMEESSSSYWKRFGSTYPQGPQTASECDYRFAQLQEYLEQAMTVIPNKMIVRFDRLCKRDTIQAIWDFVADGSFPQERWEMLETFQVNVIASRVRLNKNICSL